MDTTYYSLATKSNFNKALRHFYSVNDVVADMEAKRNLADVMNTFLDEEEVSQDQILPVVGALLRDRYGYSARSINLLSNLNEFESIYTETMKWTAVDIVIVYFTSGGKVLLINPKNPEHWERVREIVQDQLAVIYARFIKQNDKKVEQDAINAIEEMMSGRDVFISPDFIDQTIAPKLPVKKPVTQAAPSKKNVTPKYAVQVSNELFHNGNVEAWKKIIESFTTKYPDLKVYIYHQNELINDINALFKWGKVKHGDSIFFQVSGEDIRGISKLQKYLYEGASHRFEQFLKIGVGKVLNLF